MSSPVVESYGTYESSAASASHTGQYPAVVNSNDLLVAVASMTANGITSSSTDFTNLLNHGHPIGPCGSILWRYANGTEGGGTFTLDLSASESCVIRVFRISGAADPSLQPPVMAAADVDVTNDTSPDPPASATGPSDTYLGIALVHFGGNPGTVGGGDTDLQTLSSAFDAGVGRVDQATSYLQFAGTGYTPAALSNATPRNTSSHTILVYPASTPASALAAPLRTPRQLNYRRPGRWG